MDRMRLWPIPFGKVEALFEPEALCHRPSGRVGAVEVFEPAALDHGRHRLHGTDDVGAQTGLGVAY